MRRTNKSGGRQPAVVPENASATATDFSELSTLAPARSLSIPRLAYTSRSWLRARMLLLKCVSYPQVRYPFPRLAYASRSSLPVRMLVLTCVSYLQVRYPSHGWLTPAAPECATFSGSIAGPTPPVTKLPEPFFHPNRIRTTTLYPAGRGVARTYSEKQAHLRGSRLRVSSGVAESLEHMRKSDHPDGGSSR